MSPGVERSNYTEVMSVMPVAVHGNVRKKLTRTSLVRDGTPDKFHVTIKSIMIRI